MKKAQTRLFIALLMIISLCATIHLNTVSTELTGPQAKMLKVLPEETPVESILPEVQFVKTILKKVVEL